MVESLKLKNSLVHSGCFSKEQGSLKKQTNKKTQNILLANINCSFTLPATIS